MADEPGRVSKALLVILDGFGIAEDPTVSAVDLARTPFIDSLFESSPHTQLSASGEDVGLPQGQFGNSEVGHLNIGAGRIVWQELSRINKDISEESFFRNEILLDAMHNGRENGRIHIMGLFSDGGVHSQNEHLFALLEMARRESVPDVYVHAFTDGRDTAPTGGIDYAREFNRRAEETGKGKLASIIGRYYAMDRDTRWERTQKAYELLVNGKGTLFESSVEAFTHYYEKDITDEFMEAILLDDSPESRIQPGDTVIYYNIRGDRARQISRALNEPGFDKFPVQQLNLHYATFTSYDETFEFARVAYPPQTLTNTLGEWVSRQGFRQFRIAETEKYPHVTYFFNGGVEEANEGEERIVIPSPKVATYDLQPEMSAPEVTRTLCEKLKEDFKLVVLNYANPDMVGHTGDMDAAIKAVETIDTELKEVLESAGANGYSSLVIADHGNADKMVKEDGSPHTAHTTAAVPAILVNYPEKVSMHPGILADVAPTLLKMAGLPSPPEMTGTPLF